MLESRTSSKAKRAPRRGNAVIWAKGIEERYGISPCTRWRWEKEGRLPPRDVNVGGKTGWRPDTIERFERRASDEMEELDQLLPA